MSQNITDFFIPIDEIPVTPPNLQDTPDISPNLHTPQRSPRNHGKKTYVLPKQKKNLKSKPFKKRKFNF